MQIKICGLKRPEDIECINRYQPEYCGFIINFPKSHRSRTPDEVRALCSKLSPTAKPVGVFVDEPIDQVAELLNEGTIAAAQLHGKENNEYIAQLRSLTSGVIWQAVQVRSDSDIEKAIRSDADFVLLDAGQGSGEVFDWSKLKGFPRPFGLAGGLKTENVPDAVLTGAALLDVSGGVETEKMKDPDKIELFVNTVRRECQ